MLYRQSRDPFLRHLCLLQLMRGLVEVFDCHVQRLEGRRLL